MPPSTSEAQNASGSGSVAGDEIASLTAPSDGSSRTSRGSNRVSSRSQKVALPTSPEKAVLEKVVKPFAQHDYLVRFTCPEFTSLCPLTGQPDFAHIVIDYVPGKFLVESKSLKLYLQSYRNFGDFHEDR